MIDARLIFRRAFSFAGIWCFHFCRGTIDASIIFWEKTSCRPIYRTPIVVKSGCKPITKNKEQRMPNDKITAVGANIAEKAAMIWNVADMLRGPFKPHEYGLVILPMTVVKRFHDCLLPTHQAVLDTYEKVKKLQVIDGFLQKASGYQFYNTSRFTFETLLADPDNIESNFRDYLSGFSANAQDVLAKFDFDNIIKRMVESNTLYLVIKEFGSEKGYLGPDKISAVDCGYIFEDLVRRFSESFGEEAGAHFTSRDIIYLMTDLLLSEADLDTSSMTVYDMAMGTSQMLSCMEERIHELNSDIEVTCFGQEFNPSTFAIAKADMMIRGGDPNNMRFGDTLSEDQFPGFTFQYIISIILTPILMSILSSENAQRFNQSKTYFTLDLLIGWHSTLLRVSRP